VTDPGLNDICCFRGGLTLGVHKIPFLEFSPLSRRHHQLVYANPLNSGKRLDRRTGPIIRIRTLVASEGGTKKPHSCADAWKRGMLSFYGMTAANALESSTTFPTKGQMNAPAVVSHSVRTMFISSSILRTVEGRRELRLCSILSPVKKVRTNSAREFTFIFGRST
jgi:hypothetical protein